MPLRRCDRQKDPHLKGRRKKILRYSPNEGSSASGGILSVYREVVIGRLAQSPPVDPC